MFEWLDWFVGLFLFLLFATLREREHKGSTSILQPNLQISKILVGAIHELPLPGFYRDIDLN